MDEQDTHSGQLPNNKGEINGSEEFNGKNTAEAAGEDVVPNQSYNSESLKSNLAGVELSDPTELFPQKHYGMPEHLPVRHLLRRRGSSAIHEHLLVNRVPQAGSLAMPEHLLIERFQQRGSSAMPEHLPVNRVPQAGSLAMPEHLLVERFQQRGSSAMREPLPVNRVPRAGSLAMPEHLLLERFQQRGSSAMPEPLR